MEEFYDRHKNKVTFGLYAIMGFCLWETFISLLAAIGAMLGDDPNWYFSFSITNLIRNL